MSRATVAQEGRLLGKHTWLGEKVEAWRASSSAEAQTAVRKRRVLMLGSGMVAGPAVTEICKRGDVELIVGMSFPGVANGGSHGLVPSQQLSVRGRKPDS